MQWLLELMGYIKGLLSAPDEERDHTHQAKVDALNPYKKMDNVCGLDL